MKIREIAENGTEVSFKICKECNDVFSTSGQPFTSKQKQLIKKFGFNVAKYGGYGGPYFRTEETICFSCKH